MGFLNDYNNRRNKRKDEEEERQRDSVSSFGKRAGREEKTGSSFMSQLGNVSKDVFRTETPSTNPYDIALETARNSAQPETNTGFMERPSVFEPTGYSDDELNTIEQNLLKQRNNTTMSGAPDFSNLGAGIGENNNKEFDATSFNSYVNNVSNRNKTYDNPLDNYGVDKNVVDLTQFDPDKFKNDMEDLANKETDTGNNWWDTIKNIDEGLKDVREKKDINYYNSLADADDFAEMSQYQKVNKPLGNYSDAEWTSYALNEIRGDQADINIMRDLGEYKYATADEVDTFNYLYNTQGADAAMDFYKRLNLSGRMTETATDYAAQAAEAHPVIASAESFVASPIKGIGYIGSALDVLSGKELDPNAWYNLPSNIQNSIRSQVSNDIIKNADNEFMGKVGSFMYQTGMSMGDFLMNLGTGSQELSLGIMGAGAASDSVIEAKKRGLSDAQALATGTIAGLAEIVSERVSIESLFNSNAQGVKYILQNFIAEGAEEVESDLINDVADLIINGDKAQMKQAYQQYLDEGLSESEAFGRMIGDQAIQYGTDFLGGAISGGIMGSVGAAGQYVNQRNIGSTMLSDEQSLNQIVNLGAQSENEETRALAQQVFDGNAKKNVIGELVQRVSSENNLYGKIIDKLRESGETQGMAEAEADAIMNHISGAELTGQDQEYLNNENVQNALNDVFGGTYDTAYANSEAANDAYSRALEMARQQRAEKMAPVTNAINNVRNIFGNKNSGAQNNTETENNAQVSEENTQKAEETETQEAVKNMPLSERAKIGAEYSKFRTEVKPVQATLNDVKAVDVTPDGLSVTLNDGQKVNPHQITDYGTSRLLEIAGNTFGDTQGAQDFIKAYNKNVNMPVFVNAAFKMINAGKNGTDINTAVENVQNDASFNTNGSGISVGFLNDMYAYGVREQKNISAKMNSKTQRAVTDLVAKGLGIEGLIKEGGIKEQGSYNPETNEITFGEDTNQSRIETLAHETTHVMKEHARDTYNELEKVVLDSFKDNGTYQKLYDHVKELYGEEASKELIHEEMIARAMQEMLFNENVINELCKEQPSLAKRILAAIRKAIEELRAVFHGKIGTAESHQLSQDIEALEKAEKLYANGLKEAAANVKENGGKKTSENDTIKYAKKTSSPTLSEYANRSKIVNFNEYNLTGTQERELWYKMFYDAYGNEIGYVKYNGEYYIYDNADIERADYEIIEKFKTKKEVEDYYERRSKEYGREAYNKSEDVNRMAHKIKITKGESSGYAVNASDGRADRRVDGLGREESGTANYGVEEGYGRSSNKNSSGKRAVGPKKDNKGDRLAEGQREYFANVDDELKDENGNLKRYYHGTETPGFSVFKPSNRKGFTDKYNAIYLTDNENVAKTYTREKNGVYPLYVKAENPYVVDVKGQTFHNWKVDNYAKKYTDIQLEASSEGHRFAYWHEDGDRKRSYGDFTIEELVDKFGEKIGIFDFADDTHIGVIYLDENGNNIPTSTDDCILHAKNNGYDSVVFNNIRDMGRFAEDYETSQVVAVFDSNQVKDIYNLTPTESKTIHFSKKDKNNIKFSYAGINAIGADMASLTEAINMLEEGKSKEEVFRETGWFQGADKKWRYEISDDAMKVFPKGDAKYLNDKEYQRYQELEKTFFNGDVSNLSKEELKEFDDLYNKFLNRKSLRVDDVIQHDKLFEAYPFLRKIQIEFVKPETMNGASGRFNATEGKIYVDLYEKARLNDLKSTIIHELQHAIQNWSGYAGGASAEMYAGINSVIDSYYYEEYKDSDTAIKRLLNKAPEEFKEKYNKISESYLMYRTTQDEKYINEAHKLEEDLEANYKKLYDDLSELEAEKKFYEDLLEEEITPEKLYWITAGEIEARDAVSRINLTEEERREKYPKRTEKHKVYIKETGKYFDDRGIRYSKKDNHGRQLSEEQIEFFKDSKVRDAEGNLQVLYHQTDNDFTIFDTRRAGAGQHDYLTPYGVFLKPNSNNIGLKGNKQMELYANITNMLNVSSRYELENYLKKDADLKDAIDSMKTIDAEYQAKFDEAKNAWSNYIVENSKQGKDLRNDPELERLMDEEEKIVEAWGKEYDKRAEKVKANVDEYLRSQGYDGVHILKDDGSFGRKVETFIAFEPNQVKDVNNLNPTKNEDIRYSIKDNNGRLLSEGQIEYFKDSKVRDEQGRLIELYHGTGAEFTIFDLNEARDTEDIEAFFFSGNKEEAEGYGNIRKFYLNLKNPADYDTAYDIFFSFKRQAGAGAKTREELIKRGYDGVIAYDEDSPEYTEYLAFYPEQIKLTSNLNPTENEDIRYSLQDDWDFDWEAAMAESEEEKIAEGMVAQNDVNILEDGFRALKDIKNAGKVNISHNKAVQIAKRYTEKYDSATGAESLATSIEAVFAYIREHDVSYDDMLRVMRDVTLPVVENIRGDEQFTEEYRDFVKSLKGTSISLNESQKKEVAYAYGSMANFRKAVAGRFNIKEDGVNIDSLWPEIVEQSGYRLDEEENSNSQPIALLELLDQMKSDKGTVNRGMSDNQLALDMALNIYTDCFKEMSMNAAKVNETEVAKRLAETKEILKDTVAKYEDAVDKMYKKMLADTKAQAQAEIDRLTQELRELNNIDTYNRSIDTDKRIVQLKRQIDRLKQQQEEDRVYRKTSRQKARENRENSRMRNAIKSIVKDLSSRLANPNKNRYVPEDLVQATIDMLESINLDTKEGNLIKEKVQKVKDAYERLGKSTNESDASDDYDPALYNMITRLKEIFDKGKSVRRLSQSELEDVLTIAKAIQTQVKNANELIKSEIAQKIDETARGVIEDVRANKEIGNGWLEDLANRGVNTVLDPRRFLNRLVGYNEDSKMMQLFDELNEGQHKMMQIQMETSEIFNGILENETEARKLTGENEEDWVETPFKDKKGNPLKIPVGMRLSLAMHMENEDNLKHIIYGGLTVPDMKLYNQGRKAEAYKKAQAEIRLIDDNTRLKLYEMRDKANELNDEKYTNQEREDAWAKYRDTVKKAEDQAKAKLQSIVDGMTDYERQFLEYAKEYFWNYSGKQINETSMALNGYMKATVENYFPIATDTNYSKRDIEGLKLDQTLEGWGNLKSRVHAKNPIFLENIVDVISKHSDMMSKYAGLAIPIRNFNKVYNYNLRDNGSYKDSVMNAINSQRGAAATEYIENLLTDLQGSRKGFTGKIGEGLDRLRGNFAAATLTANLGVAIKQAASIYTAADVLGHDAIAHVTVGTNAAKHFWGSFTHVHKLDDYIVEQMEEIKKYSPLVWYRNQGNSTQELKDLKNKKTVLDKFAPTRFVKNLTGNWIQNIDTATVTTLWEAAKYRISKDTDLEYGSEEYFKEVAKIFNKAVEQTQPNYTTLQRPDILRNPNELVRNVIMFATQPLQNLGICVDSTANYLAKYEAYKNNQTEENKAKLDIAGKRLARSLSAVAVSMLVFSLMQMVAKGLRHKVDDYRDENGELTFESVLSQIMRDFGSSAFGMVPLGSEIYDALAAKLTGGKYYGFEVSTIKMVTDFLESAGNLFDATTDFMFKGETEKLGKSTKNFIFNTASMAGIPVKNLYNLGNGIVLFGQDFKKLINGEPFFFESGYTRSNKVNQNRLYEAMVSGDDEKFDDVYAEMLRNGTTPDKIYGGSGSAGLMVKDDLLNGNIDVNTAVDYLEKLGAEDASEKVTEWVKDDTKEKFEAGTIDEEEAEEALMEAGMGANDAHFKVQEWETGSTSAYIDVNNAISSGDPEAIVKAVNEMLEYGYTKDDLKGYSGISKNFKEQYIDLYHTNKTEAASLKSAILTYYQACGMSREDAAKKVDKWVE